MNSFLIILSCLAAVSLANPAQEIVVEYRNGVAQCRINCHRNRWQPTWGDCPPVDCGPAIRDEFCGAPDCSIPGNRYVLHPHPDPNFFWQCGPGGPGIPSAPLQRKCGCGTLYSLQYDRCVHPHEWFPDCPNQPTNPPPTNPEHCSTECPDCNGPSNVWNPQFPWNQQPNNPQNPWNQQPNRPQHPTIPQVPNSPQFPWVQQPNNPQRPSIPQVPNPPQNPWNQQPNNPQNPWNQEPNIPNPWDQQPNNPQRPWNPQPPQPQPIWPQW